MAVEDLTRIYGEMGAIEQLHEFLSSVIVACRPVGVVGFAVVVESVLKLVLVIIGVGDAVVGVGTCGGR